MAKLSRRDSQDAETTIEQRLSGQDRQGDAVEGARTGQDEMTIDGLAAAIVQMTYGDLMKVCEAFAEMTALDNGVRPSPRSAEDFASLLYDWADAEQEEKRAAERGKTK